MINTKANERCKDHLGGQLTKFESTKLECSRNVRSRHFQPLQIHKKTSIDIDSQKIEKNLRGSQRSNPPPCRLSKWSDSDGAVAPRKRLIIWIARFRRFHKETWMNLRKRLTKIALRCKCAYEGLFGPYAFDGGCAKRSSWGGHHKLSFSRRIKKMIKKTQVIRLLVLAGAHLGLSSGELGLLFTSAAGQVREEVKYYLLVR